MSNPQPIECDFDSPHGESCVIVVPAHDPAQGPLQSVAVQVTCDLEFNYTVDNPGAQPATVVLAFPASFAGVEVRSPNGTQMGYVTFTIPSVGMIVPPHSSVGPQSQVQKGLVGYWQSLHGGPFTEFEGPPGSMLRLRLNFPAQFVTQQSSSCTIKQEVAVKGKVSVLFT